MSKFVGPPQKRLRLSVSKYERNKQLAYYLAKNMQRLCDAVDSGMVFHENVQTILNGIIEDLNCLLKETPGLKKKHPYLVRMADLASYKIMLMNPHSLNALGMGTGH